MRKLIRADGTEYRFNNLAKFCREHNLPYKAVHDLIRGRRSTHCGVWYSTHKKSQAKRLKCHKRLVNIKTGEFLFIDRSLQQFSKLHGFCVEKIEDLVNGKLRAYKNWVLQETYDVLYCNPLDSDLTNVNKNESDLVNKL